MDDSVVGAAIIVFAASVTVALLDPDYRRPWRDVAIIFVIFSAVYSAAKWL